MEYIQGILIIAVIGFIFYGIVKLWEIARLKKAKRLENEKEDAIKKAIREILVSSDSDSSQEMINKCYSDYINYFNETMNSNYLSHNNKKQLVETYLFAVIAYNNALKNDEDKNEFLFEFSDIINGRKVYWEKLKPYIINLFQDSLMNPMMDTNAAFKKILSNPEIYSDLPRGIRYSISTDPSAKISSENYTEINTNENSFIDEKSVNEIMSSLKKFNMNIKIDLLNIK